MHSKAEPIQSSVEALRYPWESHPGPDQVVEVRPGVLWVRLKLPFRLNHVNIYLLEDGDGWAMVDSGFGNEESISAWRGGSSSVSIARFICRRWNICSRSIIRTAAPRSAATRSGCSSAVTAW